MREIETTAKGCLYYTVQTCNSLTTYAKYSNLERNTFFRTQLPHFHNDARFLAVHLRRVQHRDLLVVVVSSLVHRIQHKLRQIVDVCS